MQPWLLRIASKNPPPCAPRAGFLRLRGARASRTVAKPPTIRHAASLFKTVKTQVGAHVRSLRTTGLPATSWRSVGRPRSLDDHEDSALEAFAQWLIESGSLAAKDLLEAAANRLCARRAIPLSPVCHYWYSQWKKDHPWFVATKFKLVEAKRLSAE